MADLHKTLQTLFKNGVEQVRVSDLETAAKRKIPCDELWAYHHAGVFRYNISLVYDYHPDKPAPEPPYTALTPSTLAVKAVKLKRPGNTRRSEPMYNYERLAKDNGIDMTPYQHLDRGRKTMVVLNLLRNREKKGGEVKW